MKLFVIVLCLLSERYLTHVTATHRFDWFLSYSQAVHDKFTQRFGNQNPWVQLLVILLPLLLVAWIIVSVSEWLLFGIPSLILNIAIFYYCIGPDNPFYPCHNTSTDNKTCMSSDTYMIAVNRELFAPIIIYVLSGPVLILVYRLLTISMQIESIKSSATCLVKWIEWVPAKVTALLYLIVGNFQAGFDAFCKLLLTRPDNNQRILEVCGLVNLPKDMDRYKKIIQAELIVEHALVVLLVCLSVFTIAAWL